jgi:hypothetical protein
MHAQNPTLRQAQFLLVTHLPKITWAVLGWESKIGCLQVGRHAPLKNRSATGHYPCDRSGLDHSFPGGVIVARM